MDKENNVIEKVKISFEEFLRNIVFYNQLEIPTVICSVIYIDRIIKQEYVICYYNLYKIFLSSLLLSAKFNEDKTIFISNFARSARIKNYDLCDLEFDFYNLLDYHLFVSTETYNRYERILS